MCLQVETSPCGNHHNLIAATDQCSIFTAPKIRHPKKLKGVKVNVAIECAMKTVLLPAASYMYRYIAPKINQAQINMGRLP